MDYNTFLRNHEQLNDTNIVAPWPGATYLPPCSCPSTTKCPEACNDKQYDFSKFIDIQRTQLVNLCQYIDSSASDYSTQSYTLCSKYALNLSNESIQQSPHQDKVSLIQNSSDYKSKRLLLQNDLKLLFPLSGSTFTFKSRDNKRQCKFDILCHRKRCYVPSSKNTSSKGITRNCKTSKSLNSNQTCQFKISIYLDMNSMNWYLKKFGNKIHSHHGFKDVNVSSIGISQLSTSMINEINKFHNSCVSSSIQQNILMTNDDVSIPIRTLLNKQYTQQRNNETNKTDFEELLHLLRNRKDHTYFVMYAKSPNTPLLTIKKTSCAKRAINNNIAIQGYVRINQQPERPLIPPRFDSHQQKILKQLLSKNESTHEVEVILAVGWARDNELRLFQKFPEVVKMDCTHSTNREERPLFNLVGKDSNNNVYNIMRCLLPSEKKAIFNTLLVQIIPKILGIELCKKVNIIITDGDSQEIKAAQNACKHVFTNAHHINCFWHLIHNAVNKTKTFHHPLLKTIVKHWLYFTARNCETKNEQDQSIRYLKVS